MFKKLIIIFSFSLGLSFFLVPQVQLNIAFADNHEEVGSGQGEIIENEDEDFSVFDEEFDGYRRGTSYFNHVCVTEAISNPGPCPGECDLNTENCEPHDLDGVQCHNCTPKGCLKGYSKGSCPQECPEGGVCHDDRDGGAYPCFTCRDEATDDDGYLYEVMPGSDEAKINNCMEANGLYGNCPGSCFIPEEDCEPFKLDDGTNCYRCHEKGTFSGTILNRTTREYLMDQGFSRDDATCQSKKYWYGFCPGDCDEDCEAVYLDHVPCYRCHERIDGVKKWDNYGRAITIGTVGGQGGEMVDDDDQEDDSGDGGGTSGGEIIGGGGEPDNRGCAESRLLSVRMCNAACDEACHISSMAGNGEKCYVCPKRNADGIIINIPGTGTMGSVGGFGDGVGASLDCSGKAGSIATFNRALKKTVCKCPPRTIDRGSHCEPIKDSTQGNSQTGLGTVGDALGVFGSREGQRPIGTSSDGTGAPPANVSGSNAGVFGDGGFEDYSGVGGSQGGRRQTTGGTSSGSQSGGQQGGKTLTVSPSGEVQVIGGQGQSSGQPSSSSSSAPQPSETLPGVLTSGAAQTRVPQPSASTPGVPQTQRRLPPGSVEFQDKNQLLGVGGSSRVESGGSQQNVEQQDGGNTGSSQSQRRTDQFIGGQNGSLQELQKVPQAQRRVR